MPDNKTLNRSRNNVARSLRSSTSAPGPVSSVRYDRKNGQVAGLTAVSWAWCRGEPLEGGKEIATKSTKRHEKNGVLPFCAFSCFLWPPSTAVNCLNKEQGHRSHGSERDIWNPCFVRSLQISGAGQDGGRAPGVSLEQLCGIHSCV